MRGKQNKYTKLDWREEKGREDIESNGEISRDRGIELKTLKEIAKDRDL